MIVHKTPAAGRQTAHQEPLLLLGREVGLPEVTENACHGDSRGLLAQGGQIRTHVPCTSSGQKVWIVN